MSNALRGNSYAGSPYVRFEAGEASSAGAPPLPSHGRVLRLAGVFAICAGVVAVGFAAGPVDPPELRNVYEPVQISNHVARGASATLAEDVRLTERTTVVKTGEGALTVPASAVGIAPLDVQVREGTAIYANDLAEAVVEPIELPATVDAKLAFWGSAKDTAHIVMNGADVEKWFDVRETNMANPTRCYLKTLTDGSNAPRLQTARYVRKFGTETNEHEMVYFRGYKSGASMQFVRADGTAHSSPPQEAAVVYGYLSVGSSFGYLVGNCKKTSEHVLCNEENGLPWNSAWGYSGGNTHIWVDGRTFERTGANLPYGFHSLFLRYNTLILQGSGFENALYSATDNTRTRGGEYLGEVMLFTSGLTAAERAAVQRLIHRKWFGSRSGTGRIAVESDAALAVDAAPGEKVEGDFQANGAGAFIKTGDGALVYRPKSFANEATPSLRLEGGSVQADRALSLDVAVGEKVTATRPVSAGGDVADGETLTVGAASRADSVEKAGEGNASISAIPSGTRRLQVAEGTLALRPTKAAARRYEVPIPNSDFSDWGGETTAGNVAANFGGWTQDVGPVAFWHYDRWFKHDGARLGSGILITRYGFEVCPPPEGKCVLQMNSLGAKAHVALTIPEPGEYELSYLLTERYESMLGARVKNYLTSGSTNIYVGTAITTTVKDWTNSQKAMRFSVAAAGAYNLYFELDNPWNDGKSGTGVTVLINALHLYRIGDRAVAWKIPNGDFEKVYGPGVTTSGRAGRIDNLLSDQLTVDGWELDTTVEDTYTRAGIADFYTYTEAGRRYGNGFNVPDRPLGGERQLLIRRTGGFAKATFTPPKGRWYLKAHAATWGEYAEENGGPKVLATIRSGETETDLGALELPKNWTLRPHVWATSFEADGTSEVTLTVTFQSEAGLHGVHLDDFELYAEYENPSELVKNGDFELPFAADKGYVEPRTHWNHINVDAYAAVTPRQYGRDDAKVTDGKAVGFGSDHGSGEYFVEPFNVGGGVPGFWQDVTFPHAGWYRLSYLAKTRANASSESKRVEAVLIDTATAVTNRIDCFHRLPRGVFCQRTALFCVDAPGTRRLTVLLPEVSTDYPAFDDFSIRYVGQDGGSLASPADEEVATEGLSVNIARDAYLQLDYAGTNRVSRLVIDGVRQTPGVVNAANCPAIIGPGSLLVQPRDIGCTIIIR